MRSSACILFFLGLTHFRVGRCFQSKRETGTGSFRSFVPKKNGETRPQTLPRHPRLPLFAASRKSLGGSDNDAGGNSPLDSYIPQTSFGSEAVPEGQRPVNEYLDVLRQPLFDWACLESGSKGLLTRLAILYAAVFGVICYPIAGATFTQSGYLLQKLVASNLGAMVLILFLLLRLYSGWGYVGSRLTSKVIEYEETGWYDGNVERKTETERKRDKFLFDSKVKPVVDRLKVFTLLTTGLCVASFIALNAAMSQKPLFDQVH